MVERSYWLNMTKMKRTEIRQKVRDWYKNNLSMMDVDPPVTIHIDELLGTYPAKRKDQIILSLQCYRDLVEVVVAARKLKTICPALSILLSTEVKKWQLEPPHLQKTRDYGVGNRPSLYLVDRDIFKEYYYCEELRRPVTVTPKIVVKGAFVISYYRCWRDREEIENNWEFSTAIYWMAYPPDFVWSADGSLP
jgi:hypothetical protein